VHLRAELAGLRIRGCFYQRIGGKDRRSTSIHTRRLKPSSKISPAELKYCASRLITTSKGRDPDHLASSTMSGSDDMLCVALLFCATFGVGSMSFGSIFAAAGPVLAAMGVYFISACNLHAR
jgi:hypothetical protein